MRLLGPFDWAFPPAFGLPAGLIAQKGGYGFKKVVWGFKGFISSEIFVGFYNFYTAHPNRPYFPPLLALVLFMGGLWFFMGFHVVLWGFMATGGFHVQ